MHLKPRIGRIYEVPIKTLFWAAEPQAKANHNGL